MGAHPSSPCGHESSDSEESGSSDSERSSSGNESSDDERDTKKPQAPSTASSPQASAHLRDFKVNRQKQPASCWPSFFNGDADLEFQSADTLKTASKGRRRSRTDALFPENQGIPIDEFYKVEWRREVGSGGYAAVYVGVHKATQEEAAIKVIRKDMIDRSRVSQEIEVGREMQHPNIAKLKETFDDNRYLYVVMELCQGGELFDFIQAQKSFSEKHTAMIMQQILRGVNYMHSKGVCHRDLKPENFLFKKKGNLEGNTLKIIDFGISAQFKSPDDTFKTKTGTPYYVAPEVLSSAPYGPLCDMWSCGVVMHILLSGKLPFVGRDDNETFAKVKRAQVNFGDKAWKIISKEGKMLVKRLLTKAAADRITPEQAVRDRWVEDHAPCAQPVSLHDNTIQALRQFQGANRFKKAALRAVARQVPDSEMDQLKDLFTKLDEDQNGTLTSTEIVEGLRQAGIVLDDTMVGLINALDVDGDGTIDYSEFLAATMDMRSSTNERACWNAFRIFDRNGDGEISREELAQVLDNEHIDTGNLQGESIDVLFRKADTNGDGQIDFEEFLSMMRLGRNE